MKFQIRLLLSGFVVSFLIVAGLTVLSFFRVGKLNAHIMQVEHTQTVLNAINHLGASLTAMNQSSFWYLTGGDSTNLRQFNAVAASWAKQTDSIRTFTADNPEQQNALVLLQSDMSLYSSTSGKLMEKAPISATELLASELYRTRRHQSDATVARLEALKDRENSLLRERTQERRSYLELTTSLIRTLTIIFGVLTLLMFYFLLREFRQRTRYQIALQQKVGELAQSKHELEYIAYATSHDLQEPLRKIRIFMDRWMSSQAAGNEESLALAGRVNTAASRMQELVAELMILASLNDDRKKAACPLRYYAESAVQELDSRIAEKGARLSIESLPVVLGYPDQLKLLFRNFLDNALKFAKPDVGLLISISTRKADGGELSPATSLEYHCIIIEDNGVGFDNRQTEKMFGIFRRLHDSPEGVGGKGTGLAICQRIMHNHGGSIVAHGFPGEGATFKLYFPIGV